MQGAEINKVSWLSIFLACSKGVFRLGGGGRRWAVFVIHKLCWQILDIICRIVSITSSADCRGQIEIICLALLGWWWVAMGSGEKDDVRDKAGAASLGHDIGSCRHLCRREVQRSMRDKQVVCLSDWQCWQRPDSCCSLCTPNKRMQINILPRDFLVDLFMLCVDHNIQKSTKTGGKSEKKWHQSTWVS